MVLSPIEESTLREFCDRVRARFGGRVAQIRLFGSRARGDAHEDSDIDVCVVVDDITWQEARDVDEITGELLARNEVLLSPFVISAARLRELEHRERAIAGDIARDGVPL